MINRHNHGLAKEFSPNDLELFLEISSNTKCFSGIIKSLYDCLGIKHPVAADFAGLLDIISPLKESKVLENAGVKKPSKTSSAAADHREQVTEAAHSEPTTQVVDLQTGCDPSQEKLPPQPFGNTTEVVHLRTGNDPSQPKNPYEKINTMQQPDEQGDPFLPMYHPEEIRKSYSKARDRFGVPEDIPSTPGRRHR